MTTLNNTTKAMNIRIHYQPSLLRSVLASLRASTMMTKCCACGSRISSGPLHFLAPANVSHGYCTKCLGEAKALLKQPTS